MTQVPPPVPTPPPTTPDDDDDDDMMPAEPTAAFLAFANGVVSPRVAGDTTTSRFSGDPSRPGGPTPVTVTAGEPADTSADGNDGKGQPTTSISGVRLGSPDSPWMEDMSARSRQLASFASTTYTRGSSSDRHTVTIFSDVQDPKPVAFSTYYGESGVDPANDRPGVASVADGVLTLDTGTDFDDTYGSLFKAGGFPKNKRDSLQYTQDQEIDGMFNGIDGTFECTASGGCSASADDDGVLATLTGEWTFTPEEDNIAKVKVPGVGNDADYLAFGYWIRERTFEGDNQLFDIGTFYAGSEVYPTTQIAALTGSARYTGPAAGAYANKDTSTSGEFTALADLTARFGVTPDTDGTFAISGTIGNFVDSGESIDETWTLTLESAPFTSTGTSFTGRTMGGGNWRGMFYGNPVGDGDTAGTTSYPGGVAGDFTGHFENGHVIGAFGATR